MIGVVVDDDGVGVPEPVAAISKFKRRDSEVITVEPEARGPSTLEMKFVPRAEAACEMAVFERMVDVEARVIGRIVMPHPLIVVRVDVGSTGVAGGVGGTTSMLLLARRRCLLVPLRSSVLLHTGRRLLVHLRRGLLAHWRRTMRRNMTIADAMPFLGEGDGGSEQQKDARERNELFHKV